MRAACSQLRKSMMAGLATKPAVPAVGWLTAGILFALGKESGLPFAPGIALGTALVFLFATPRRFYWLLLCLPLGYLLTPRSKDYTAMHLPREICLVRARGVVTSRNISGNPRAWLTPRRRAVMKLQALRARTHSAWVKAPARILLAYPPDVPLPHYGEIIELEGTWHPPDSALFPQGFNYRRHLWKQNIQHQIDVRQARSLGHSRLRVPLVWLLSLREKLAALLAADCTDPTNQAILLAMTLGYRRAIPTAVQQRFLHSGAVHIFAISGIHVALFAMLARILIRLTGMPIHRRPLILLPLIWLYVFLSGGAPSSIRAGTMLSCWWLSRALSRPPSPLNAMATAAFLLLLYNPLYLLQTGFIFSFTIVFGLVAGYPAITDVLLVFRERNQWLPPAKQPKRHWNPPQALLSAIAVSFIAWLASAALVAFYNSMLIPAGILLNIFIVALAAPILALAFLKCILSAIGLELLGWGSGRLAEGFVSLLRLFVELGAESSGSLPVPTMPKPLVLAYYSILAIALIRTFKPRTRLLALCLALALLFTPPFLPSGKTGNTLLLGGNPITSLIFCTPTSPTKTIILNPGDYRTATAISEFLRSRGIRDIDRLILTGGSRQHAAGLQRLLDRHPVRTLIIPKRFSHSLWLRRAAKKQEESGHRLRFLDFSTHFQLEQSDLQLSGRDSRGLRELILSLSGTDYHGLITIAQGESGTVQFSWFTETECGSNPKLRLPSSIEHGGRQRSLQVWKVPPLEKNQD